MTPEDQLRNQSELLRMVEDFDLLQAGTLEALKQNVIDSGEAMRQMVDTFLMDIGPALDIVAGTNQQAADALSNISEVDLQGHLDETESILQGGVTDIATQVGRIGSTVANAIRSGFSGVDFNVTVTVDQGGLVTQ